MCIRWRETFSFAGLFVYVAGSPAIFMDGFHVSAKVYGGIFCVAVGRFYWWKPAQSYFIAPYGRARPFFKTAVIVQVCAALIYFIGVYYNWYGLTGNLVCLFIILACTGLTYPNAAAIAMAPFSKNAGTASALLGFLQLGIGGLISSGAGILHLKGSLATSITMMVSTILALTILLTGGTRIVQPVTDEVNVFH